ncbi:hypothetical protein E2320_021455 [Naja naja]|nr:hypothetical protein E2320_021455 [Naja naja]
MFVVNHCWDDKQHIRSAVAIMERLGVGTVHSALQGPLVMPVKTQRAPIAALAHLAVQL